MIADASRIELGPMVPTLMKGLYSRTLRVSNDRGQSVTATIYTNATADKLLIPQGQAQIYDLTKDPWEKIDLKSIHLEDRSVMGPATAPVTIVEFADFECPFCARAFGTLETMVHSTYKDKIRVIYKNYPLNSHPWAIRAAIGRGMRTTPESAKRSGISRATTTAARDQSRSRISTITSTPRPSG